MRDPPRTSTRPSTPIEFSAFWLGGTIPLMGTAPKGRPLHGGRDGSGAREREVEIAHERERAAAESPPGEGGEKGAGADAAAKIEDLGLAEREERPGARDLAGRQ